MSYSMRAHRSGPVFLGSGKLAPQIEQRHLAHLAGTRPERTNRSVKQDFPESPARKDVAPDYNRFRFNKIWRKCSMERLPPLITTTRFFPANRSRSCRADSRDAAPA